MKYESSLKSALGEEIKTQLPGYFWMRLEDVRESGHPDGVLTGRNFTSWWEVKHGTPDFKSKGVQEDTCRKLAGAGFCRYLVYWELPDVTTGGAKRTLIIHPKHFWRVEKTAEWFRGLHLLAEDFCFGFNHHFVTSYMRKVHER